MPKLNTLLILTFTLASSLVFGRVVLLKDPPRPLEKKFSEAVLLFYQKDYPGALKLTDEILKDTENQKTLELKGLILKSSGDFAAARTEYLYLLNRIKDAGLAPTEGLAARFDLGVIEYNFKNYKAARDNFDFCLEHGFNQGAAYFFRALSYQGENEPDRAMGDFNSVLASKAQSLKALAALYLSDLYARRQGFDEAVRYLAKARVYADAAPGGLEVPADVQSNQAQLKARIAENINLLNTPQYFKNVALIASYDSNVLAVPAAGSVADVFSGKSSNKIILKALLGHAEGYFEDVQNVWSYQFSGNLNQNRETETGQFLTNDFNYLWNVKPYSDFVQSFRVGLNSNFQYQVNPTDNKGSFGPYSLAGTLGYATVEKLNEDATNNWDYSLKYESFLQDPAFSDFMKKTGVEAAVSYLRGWDAKKFFWNPALGLGLHARRSTGLEYRNYGAVLTATNQFYFTTKHQAGLLVSYGYFTYPERPGVKRTDNIYNAEWNETYQVTESLALLLNLSYTQNDSNITDIYKFNRYLVSAGVNFTF